MKTRNHLNVKKHSKKKLKLSGWFALKQLFHVALFLFGTQSLHAQSISTWHAEGGLLFTSNAATDFYGLDTDSIALLGSYTMGTHPVVWGYTVNTLTDDTTDFEILVTAYDIYNGTSSALGVDTTSAMAFNKADKTMDFNSFFYNTLPNNITIQFNFFEYGTRTNTAFNAGTGGTTKRNNLGITAPNFSHGIGRLITTELYTVDNMNSAAPLAFYESDSCVQVDPGTIGIDTIRFAGEFIDASWMATQEGSSSYPFNLSSDKVFFHTMEVEDICDPDGNNKLHPDEAQYDILFGAVSSVAITRQDIKKSNNTTSGVKSNIGFYIDSVVYLAALPVLDLDGDNDGIVDIDESGGNFPDGDEDGDGTPNYLDNTDDGTGDGSTTDYTDSNADGVPDVYDADGDGVANHLDLDSDNDGIPDLIEAGGIDTDGNGIVDDVDANGLLINDIDGDGLDDAYDPNNGGTALDNFDSDGDGIVDTQDLDADNDGIPDIVENGGVDSNGDGLVDTPTDADGDGFADNFDPDDDGTFGVDSGEGTQPLVITDGSANLLNGETSASLDTDGDGLADAFDVDSDNDGIPDLVEAGGIDTDGNGRTDTSTDADGDGYPDIYDTDDDGTPGVEDATDALLQTGGTDSDGDGKADDAAITFEDGNGNSADHDGDGYIDGKDLDADNDGVPDLLEAGGADPNSNGKVDTGAVPWDADGDGLADIYDESASDGPAGSGTNGTALVETTADTNADGIVNNTESMAAGGSNNINADTDSNPNHLDLDSDNDGITDVVENASGDATADHSSGTLDGIVGDNATVTDVDGDGWNDASTSSITDTDSDGIPDYLDQDSDNDGIPDYLESVCSTCPTFTAPTGSDSDGDGVLDMYESLTSANGNGGSNTGTTPNEDDDDGANPPDYLDTDSDNDTAFDWTEGFDLNNDGSAIDDIMTMATDYETATSNGYYINGTDTDSDGLPDYLDNQPSVAGYNENARPPFLDSGSSHWHDDNSDGLAAIFDANESGTTAPTPDIDATNDNDWRDMATLIFLPVELIAFDGFSKDCNVILKWSTASERDFNHFEVEHSRDGYSFQKIATINGQGGDFTQEYQYRDNKATKTNYYRLKMVDNDRSYEYSKLISIAIECGDKNSKVSVFPNPSLDTQHELTIEWADQKNDFNITIFDNLGQAVFNTKTDNFNSSTKINVENLHAGTYFILLNDGDNVRIIKYIKSE